MPSPRPRAARWTAAVRVGAAAAIAASVAVAVVAAVDGGLGSPALAALGVAVTAVAAAALGAAVAPAPAPTPTAPTPPRPADDPAHPAVVRAHAEDRLRAALTLADRDDEALVALHGAVARWWSGRWSGVLATDRTATRLVVVHLEPDEQPPAEASAAAVADCLALRRLDTAISPSSDDFDACPHLRGAVDAMSGVCVPIVLDGEVLGVIRWIGPPGRPLGPNDVAALEGLADMTAWRIGALGAVSQTTEVPHLDPLTGLLNRRSTGLAVRDLVRDLVPFTLAVCDLDDFDAYNEHHGHDRGDRALRLLARVLRATLRPGDVLGRTGGDELMVAFPRTSAIDAASALERVRESLVLSLTTEDVPPFTASFGVADSNQADSIEGIVRTAHQAVAMAKEAGRNRVVVAGEADGASSDASGGAT
ncbi:MAG TPA: sensor domain-containing diguanylate cyclase [Acidimicrobiales bacterium]|nr:sensor domain-containing diguanylate cyclase [Acidimicrobiales bacterium]